MLLPSSPCKLLVIGEFLVSAFTSLLLLALPAQTASDRETSVIAQSFKYISQDGVKGLRGNTLVMKVGDDGNEVEAVVLKWTSSGSDNYRTKTSRRIVVSKDDWEGSSDFVPVPNEDIRLEAVANGQWNVRVKHRVHDRFDRIANSDLTPIRFSVPPTASTIICDPEPSQVRDIENLVKAAEKSQQLETKKDEDEKAETDKDPRAAAKSLISEQLKVDLSWQAEILDDIIDRRGVRALLEQGLNGGGSSAVEDAQEVVMQELLKAAALNPDFQSDPSRLDQLMLYNTLYGEFRRKDAKGNHRSLAHLFWASESVVNRLKYPPKNSNRRARLQAVQDDYLKLVPKDRYAMMNGRLTGVVLSSLQYSAFNTGEATLSDILLRHSAQIDPQIEADISDFIAAYRSGYVKVAKEPRPVITHYVSPKSLPQGLFGAKYPGFWSSDKMTIFKGKSSLPAVSREDLEKTQSKSVKSAKPNTDESRIEPQWFEGGKEEW